MRSNMEKVLSAVYQMSFVVGDIEKAIEAFAALGIGPFEPLQGITCAERRVEGKLEMGIKNDTRVAYAGDMEIELIKPISGNSPAMQFLKTKGEGFHHFAFLVKDAKKARQEMEKKGFKLYYDIKYGEGSGGCVYFETELPGKAPIEFFQPPYGWHKNRAGKAKKT
jgi:methylmalonyl-CoA/ethylmalonyl-CoA epimerase